MGHLAAQDCSSSQQPAYGADGSSSSILFRTATELVRKYSGNTPAGAVGLPAAPRTLTATYCGCRVHFSSSASMPDPLSLSDRLALQRTRLANERTFLTYVRTSLAMLGFGLVLIQLHPVRTGLLGHGAVAAAALVLLTGWIRFHQRRKEIEAS